MGHTISGIIAPFSDLSEFSREKNLHSPARLVGDLGFLPLSDSHLDQIFPNHGSFDLSMTYLSEAVKGALKKLSSGARRAAFIETDYWAGDGAQGATVYLDEVCIMEPRTESIGPVSQALRLLGVEVGNGMRDEFETAGLGRHRYNEDWIAVANPSTE